MTSGASAAENTATIAVVGSGPIGMISALSLAHSTSNIHLIGPVARKDGRTTAILNEGVNLLNAICVWSDLSDKVAPLQSMRIVDGTKRLIRAPEARFDASELDLDAFGYNVRNGDLNDALADAIADHPNIVWHKEKVERIEWNGHSMVQIFTEGANTIAAPLVVGADGRNSPVREAAGIEAKRWDYPQVAIVMNLSHSRAHDFISTEFHTESGPFTLVPLTGNHSSLVWVVDPNAVEDLLARPRIDLAKEISVRSHYLLGDVDVTSEPMTYPLSGLSAEAFGSGPFALVGEAAHVFPPIGAQGMNLGFRDIRDITRFTMRKSERDIARSALDIAKSYDRARRLDITMRTNAVDALNRSLLSDFIPVSLGRGLGLYALNKVPALRKFIMRQGLGARKSA